ncbi:MAG TPA: GAP family protein [Solirubrobacteraceae bacterium]|nr:GAP family protein [Solirubrobacteraceae bacterium]
MLDITLLVASLAVADSVNPVTIAVALSLASVPAARRRGGAGFIAGVAAVYGAGGVLLLLGSERVLALLEAGRDSTAAHVGSLAAGVTLLGLAAVVIAHRDRVCDAGRALSRLDGRSAFVLGAGVTLIDLPTALPLFAAVAAIAGAGVAAPAQVVLLGGFVTLYVLPLALIALIARLAQRRAQRWLAAVRRQVDRWAAAVMAACAALTGAGLVIGGAGGLL